MKIKFLWLVISLMAAIQGACKTTDQDDANEQLIAIQQTIDVLSVQATQAAKPSADILPQDGSDAQMSEEEPARDAYKDLSFRPQIWLSPLDPMSLDQIYPGQGPFEFFELFQADALWQQASDAVQVIKLYVTWAEGYSTPGQLAAVIADITARGMAISFELGPLQETEACNAATIEGFAGEPVAVKIASGLVKTEEGQPVPQGKVVMFATPLEGDGLITNYILTGNVPEDATFANVGFRINMECDCRGPAVFKLEQVLYIEGNQTSGQVPNGNFDNGLNGWELWGNGGQLLVPNMVGNGVALSVKTNPTSDAGANSGSFPVSPGESFTVTFTAQVSPLTDSAGYFSLFFLNKAGEVSRLTIPVAVGKTIIATGSTRQDGTFSVNLEKLPAGSCRYSAWYPGSEAYWPALLTISN